MVRNFLNFLGREISGLHEAAYLLGFFAILSQVLALVRDRLLAHTFGAGTTLDLYYAAFRIPDFIFVIVASYFSASIIIPFLSAKMQNGENSGRDFLSVIFSFYVLAMIVVCGVAFFVTPLLVPHLFPGFADGPHKAEVVMLTRILLLSPIFLGLSNLFASVTQLYNRFFIYGISPLLYNAGIIIGVIVLAPRFGTVGLVWGVALGAILHFLVQLPFVVSRGLLPRLVFNLKKYRDVVKVLIVAFPRTLALSAQEVSEFFLVSFASLMSAGSIAVFNLSWNLQSVPLSIIGVSYSLAAFPTLSTMFAAGHHEKFVELLRTTARYIIFFSLPLVALFVVLRAYIVRVILGSGQFTWQDTRLTAAALALFTISLAAQGLILLFTRARYAAGNTRKAFYINMFFAILTMLLAVFLNHIWQAMPAFPAFIESLFRVKGVPGTSVLVLPLAFSIGNIIGAVWHIFSFDRDYKNIAAPLVRLTVELLLVSVAMGFATYLTLYSIQNLFSLNTFMGVLSQGLIAGVVGIVSGMILLALLGSKELGEVYKVLRRKIWKAVPEPVVGPDPVDMQ